MKDNNENNVEETLDSIEESVADTDVLDDGIVEEEVDGSELTDDAELEDDVEEDTHVTRFPDNSNASFADKLSMLTKKQIGCIAVIAVVVIAVIVAIVVLASSGKKNSVNVNTNTSATAVSKATQEATAEQATTVPVVKPEKDVSFDELTETNEDIYAYIYIPGTEIEYPILQSESKGENYYLNYTVNNYYSWTGAIYTQFTYNKKDFSDKNTIIYGHAATRNINSVMFTQLHYYEEEDFLKANPYIYIYEGDRQLKYQIFAAVHFTDVLIPLKYGVNDGASMVQFVQDAKTTYGGVVDESVVIDEDSKIITLSTCTMVPNYDDNKRFLVIAKLVEESVVEK